MENLSEYLKKLKKLNRAYRQGIKAPHKPILLISVIQGIACGEVIGNRISITPELVAKFRDNWNLLVKGNIFQPNFALPFYHLKNEGFWHLQTVPGKEILLTSSLSIKSFSQLKETVTYAYFDEPLYALLANEKNRNIIYALKSQFAQGF